MDGRPYLYISGTIFGAVALLHVIRVILDVPVQVGTLELPIWISWGGGAVAIALCTWAFRLVRG